MDWLLTVPLLLIEILLVMTLSPEVYAGKAWNLVVGSALINETFATTSMKLLPTNDRRRCSFIEGVAVSLTSLQFH